MEMYNLLYLYLNVFVHLLFNLEFSFGLSCKNEKNQNVDWFIVYKIPMIEKERKGSRLRSGLSYAYLTSENPEKWILSSRSVEAKNSILGINLEHSRKKHKKGSSATHLFYSDDPPLQYHKRVKKNIGHLKGYLAFDVESGMWLTHTIPKYTRTDKHKFPSSAIPNGHMAICITLPTEYLNSICHYLLYCHPNIYKKELTKGVKKILDKTAQSLFSEKPHFIGKPPFVEEFRFRSKAGVEFFGYAKDEMEESDLYSNILSKYLNEDLIVQSWRSGAKGALSPSCDSRNTVSDVLTIHMAFPNRKKEILFTFTTDHSKWAISADSANSVVCIGDVNRMKSHSKRGGGALCFASRKAWRAFKSLINDVHSCSS